MGTNPRQDANEFVDRLGLRTRFHRTHDGVVGFPASLPLPDGSKITLDPESPIGFGALDPAIFGVVVVDPLGYVLKTWGIAKKIELFDRDRSLLDTPLGTLITATKRSRHHSVCLDGVRFHNATIDEDPIHDITIVAVSATEEGRAERDARRAKRAAGALRRLGRALTMDPRVEALCTTVAHEIASSLELSAAMIWTTDPDKPALELAASVGINRFGVASLQRLSANGGESSIAERVAETRKPFHTDHVADHPWTSATEGRVCYLKPGPGAAFPLVNSGRLLGVIEFIGRDEDEAFLADRELLQTIADHVALALNSAMLLSSFERLALHDPLTGLANHRALHDFLEKRLSESVRRNEPVGVAMIDVDHFRAFNEEEGHEAGDNVLKLVAEALRGCLRPYDLPARYGGEEFTIVMPGAPRHALLAAAERIRERVAEIPYKSRSGRRKPITVSVGCAAFPDTAFEAATLLRAADSALYHAKRSGRNRVEWHEGAYSNEVAVHRLHFDLSTWIDGELFESRAAYAAELITEHRGWLDRLNLSVAQSRMLEALIQIAPTYRMACEDQRIEMQRSDELRALAPSLIALDDRADAKGEDLPLLARILAVMEASVDELAADPGRFDPEIAEFAIQDARAA